MKVYMTSIYERAVISAFQQQVDKGGESFSLQLKSIERRARTIAEREADKVNLNSLIGTLIQGLVVQLGQEQFVAQLTELKTSPGGGLIKRLNREVDKKTKNPKTSRGTVWRRNSTVQERRRQLPNWRNGTSAQTEARRLSRVELVPYEIWLGKRRQAETQKRQREL